ncbi:MAG: fumarylacetoacetate hydrolase family protein [Pseudomonadota bacterium]
MRLITFAVGQETRMGVIDGDAVYDITARTGIRSVRMALEDGPLDRIRAAAAGDADFLRNEITLDLPVADPPKIFCVGVNYGGRNAEYRDGSTGPAYPSLFMRSPLSFVPHGQPLWLPPESEQLDYEGEIVLVIGKAGRRIPEDAAHDHIAGLTIMNEGSIRDWLRHGKFNVTQGKNWDRSGGLGPWVETDLGDLDLGDLTIETHVNGELRQTDTTASMAFPFSRIIAYISTFCTLLPGDLIATGTPTGAGARFDPPKWLKPGDRVTVSVDGVGVLENTIEAEPAP